MKLEDINLKMKFSKTYGCVIVDPDFWVETSSLKLPTMRGFAPSRITKVVDLNLDTGVFNDELSKGDYVLLSSVARRLIDDLTINIAGLDKTSYAHVHMDGVLGKFENNEVSSESFTPLYGRVLGEHVPIRVSRFINVPDEDVVVLKITKVGSGGFDTNWNRLEQFINVGDYVLIDKNTETKLIFGGDNLYCVDNKDVLGKFTDRNNLNLDNIKMFGNNTLLLPEKELRTKGSMLRNFHDEVKINYRYRVICSGSTRLYKDSIVYITRSFVSTTTFKKTEYTLISDMNDIACLEVLC